MANSPVLNSVLAHIRLNAGVAWWRFFLFALEVKLAPDTVRALRWENASREDFLVLIPRMRRPVRLTERAVRTLDAIVDDGDWPAHGYIFPSPRDPQKPISREGIRAVFRKACASCGVPRATLYDLRPVEIPE